MLEVPRSAERTRERILAKATEEFARYGLAGARVDRIAQQSQSNKQLIYAYFDSKQGLFDAVISHHLASLLDEVPFTADDLAGYAGRLFDHAQQHPALIRLSQWFALETDPGTSAPKALVDAIQQKVTLVRGAQDARKVSADIPAKELLPLIVAISHAWTTGPDSRPVGRSAAANTRRRKAVVAAVKKLIE